jgi:hypothetical protein
MWARVLVSPLPRTTAAMLWFDFLLRTRSGLDPRLAASLRWVAARARGCAYAEAYALADLQRGGWCGPSPSGPAASPIPCSAAPADALAFAEKLTIAPGTVTDAEIADLRAAHGEEQFVAMVLLLAHASFQDLFTLVLGLRMDPTGPLAPLALPFAQPPTRVNWRVRSDMNRICLKYQPQLAATWLACVSAFRKEGQVDPALDFTLWQMVSSLLGCVY